jgi:hypothetical protein
MNSSNRDNLVEFDRIIDDLRNNFIKDKEAPCNAVQQIHYLKDLRTAYPGKEHTLDFFPKYFQRNNRDILEGQCNIKFTGMTSDRQLVIRKDSKILKQHYVAFSKLNEHAIKLLSLSLSDQDIQSPLCHPSIQ